MISDWIKSRLTLWDTGSELQRCHRCGEDFCKDCWLACLRNRIILLTWVAVRCKTVSLEWLCQRTDLSYLSQRTITDAFLFSHQLWIKICLNCLFQYINNYSALAKNKKKNKKMKKWKNEKIKCWLTNWDPKKAFIAWHLTSFAVLWKNKIQKPKLIHPGAANQMYIRKCSHLCKSGGFGVLLVWFIQLCINTIARFSQEGKLKQI